MEEETIIKVECYSGYRADEKPVNFIFDERKLKVEKIIEQWRSPDYNYFKIKADDGKGYILKNSITRGSWFLEKIFQVE